MPSLPLRLLDQLRQLIATPSISSVSPEFDQSNQPVIHLLANWLEDAGFTVRIEPLVTSSNQPKANLIASLGSGPGGLVLAGHTDTVPFDVGLWQFDPFGGIIADDRLYGLGAADMKSFLVLALEAARAFADREFRQPLILVATADEESSMAGARALAASGQPLGRHAVIGEPTDLKPARLHKGILMEALRLEGRAGHSSNPALGVNALEGMYEVIGELLRWRAELQARYHHPLFEVAVPTLNLGRIQGGDNPNRICPTCELHIDIRPLPGMTLEQVRHELEDRIQRLLSGREWTWRIFPLFPGIEALETPASAAIVQAVEALTGVPAGAVNFGTEGPYFQALGMDPVLLGPGSVACAHQPNEFLPLATIPPMVTILQELIQQFCIAPYE